MGKSKVIIPRKLSVDPAKMARAIQNTLTNVAENIRIDFLVTVQTWEHKPTFAIIASAWSRTVGTDGDIYAMLNKGTRPHIIRPKAGGVLVFRTPFRSKTLPRSISSGAGGKGLNQVITRGPVHHPGTAAREWDQVIAQKWDKQVGPIFQRAIDAAAR